MPLLLSNKDKKILFKDIYEDLKTKSSLSRNEFNTILSCNKYMNNKNLLPKDFNEDEYILNISKLLINTDYYEEYLEFRFDIAKENIEFINKLKSKCIELLRNIFFNNLKEYKNNKNIKGFNDTLEKNIKFIGFDIHKDIDIDLINNFKDNNWFLSLNDTISLEEWRMNISICSFISDYPNAYKEIKNYLHDININSKDDEVFDRTKILIDQYLNKSDEDNIS